MSPLDRFDPRLAAPVRVDGHLPPVPPERLTPDSLRERFANPPIWAPEFLRERPVPGRVSAPASVLVPLVLRDEQLSLLLTERGRHLSTHSGQIAFPGGRQDESDRDPVHTALREAQEEVGLAPSFVEVLGTLPVYVTGTAFIITPVVALVRPGFELQPNPHEVADVFEVPLPFLMNPAHHRHHEATWAGDRRQFMSMPWTGPEAQERFIWGATAGMLRNLYRFLVS
ncbi:MAG: CoA pyrophosphatase [Betaproteobacteria bacterium]